MDRRRALVVAAALLLLAGVVAAVGPRAVLVDLRRAAPLPFLAACASALVALACWSEAQRRLHRVAGASVDPPGYLLAYLAGAFGKLSLPGGQAGGPAVMAYALGRRTDLAYGEDLAAASVGKLLGVVAATVPVLGGAVALTLPARAERAALVAVAVVTAGVGLFLLVATRRPNELAGVVHALAALVRATLGGASARVRTAVAPERVDASLDRVRGAFAAVAADRRALAVAFLLTVAGWLAYAAPLFAAARALGHPVSLALALFVVPVASLGTLVPLPSGLVGVDLLAGALLVALAGLAPASAAAVVLLYRAATALVPAVAGAAASVRVMAPHS